MMFVTWVLVPASFTPYCFELINDSEAFSILNSTIEDSQKLLNFQPSLFIYSYNSPTFILPILSICLYGTCRTPVAVFLLYQNFNYAKNPKISYSQISRKRFRLMLQASLIQLFILVAISPFAMILAALTLISNNIFQLLDFVMGHLSLPRLTVCCLSITSLYPIFHVIGVLIAIKPYRIIIKDMCSKCLRKWK